MCEIYTVIGVTDSDYLLGGDISDLIMAAVQRMHRLSTQRALVARELVYKAVMEVWIYNAVFDGGRVPGLEQYLMLAYVNPTANQACLEVGLLLEEVTRVVVEQMPANSALLVRLPLYFTR